MKSADANVIGPLMLDVEGFTLTQEEKKLLCHPLVGGLILFSRNYASPAQLKSLIADIRVCNSNILIGVDHEGGRVQRFRDGFTRIPPMRVFGELYGNNPIDAKRLAKECGWLFASELRAFDIDFSFAPVLDLDYGVSTVIGDRAFSGDEQVVADLANALISGMREAGMASTGKHFPGHGAIVADSHVSIPIDTRAFDVIEKQDIVPFKQLIANGLDAVMPAHVVYSNVDDKPAGFSPFWLQRTLREKMQFEGVIFSDDLTMEGASVVGGYAERAEAALSAGCDMILTCNNRQGALEALQYLEQQADNDRIKRSSNRLQRMRGAEDVDWALLKQSSRFKSVLNNFEALV